MAKLRGGIGFGFVMLLVTLAIVLFLVARSWESMAPTATQLDEPEALLEKHGQTQPQGVRNVGELPNLDEMRQATDAHAQEVQDALAEIE